MMAVLFGNSVIYFVYPIGDILPSVVPMMLAV